MKNTSAEQVCAGGPIGARNLVIFGAFWTMRELELSCARTKQLCVDLPAQSVEWCPPASKTDVLAVGKVRR